MKSSASLKTISPFRLPDSRLTPAVLHKGSEVFLQQFQWQIIFQSASTHSSNQASRQLFPEKTHNSLRIYQASNQASQNSTKKKGKIERTSPLLYLALQRTLTRVQHQNKFKDSYKTIGTTLLGSYGKMLQSSKRSSSSC